MSGFNITNIQPSIPVKTENGDHQFKFTLTVNVPPELIEKEWNNQMMSKMNGKQAAWIVTTNPLVLMVNGKQYDFGNAAVNKVLDDSGRVTMKFYGNVMTEYDKNKKKVYEGGFTGSMSTGFVRNGRGMVYDGQDNFKQVCDYEKGELKRVIQSFIGNTMIEYNENGKKVYEGGYVVNEEKGICRHGKGVEMDERGNIVKSGVWKNGMNENRIARTIDALTAHPGEIEELNVANNSFNETTRLRSLYSGVFTSLKRVIIGEDCFAYVRDIRFDGLQELESITIGGSCFTLDKHKKDVMSTPDASGDVRIANCPKLVSISIGNYSFSSFASFVLEELPSLQTIDMGGYCFYRASVFSLTSLYLE